MKQQGCIMNPSVYGRAFCQFFCQIKMQGNHQQGLSPYATGTQSHHMVEDFTEKSDVTGVVCNEQKQPAVYQQTGPGVGQRPRVVYRRAKWTDEMVKLLISAASYIGKDFEANNGYPKTCAWVAIAIVLHERGHTATGTQCECKFNTLNKYFKKLTDVFGRASACFVVDNPAIVELLDLTLDVKEDVKWLLSRNQLFYKEMCSYHYQNRLFLPHDPELQQAVLLALKRTHAMPSLMYQDPEIIRREENGSNKLCASQNSAIRLGPNVCNPDNNGVHDATNIAEGETLQNEKQIMHRLVELEEKKLQIETEILEVEKQRFEYLDFFGEDDKELERMKLQLKEMNIMNRRVELQIMRLKNRMYY